MSASTRHIPEAIFVGAGIAFLPLSRGCFKMANVFNQGIMARGYKREDTPSLSPYPVISLSKTAQLSDETHEGAGDNCKVLE